MNAKREMNLIPEEVLARDKGIRRIWVWSGVIGLVLVVLLGLVAVEKRNSGAVERIIEDLKARNQEIEERLGRLAQLQQQRNRLARKERAIHGLMVKRSLCALFAQMETLMAGDVWLTELDYEDATLGGSGETEGKEEGYTATGYILIKDDALSPSKENDPPAPQVAAVLRGMALSYETLADFLEQLSRSGRFSNVALRRVQKTAEQGIQRVEFEAAGALQR